MKVRYVAFLKVFELFRKNPLKFKKIIEEESCLFNNFEMMRAGYYFSFKKVKNKKLFFIFFKEDEVVYSCEMSYTYSIFKGLYFKFTEDLSIDNAFFVEKINPIFERILIKW